MKSWGPYILASLIITACLVVFSVVMEAIIQAVGDLPATPVVQEGLGLLHLV